MYLYYISCIYKLIDKKHSFMLPVAGTKEQFLNNKYKIVEIIPFYGNK